MKVGRFLAVFLGVPAYIAAMARWDVVGMATFGLVLLALWTMICYRIAGGRFRGGL